MKIVEKIINKPKNEKITEREFTKALAASVVCIVLCLAGLVGSTFAWYSANVSVNVANITIADFYADTNLKVILPNVDDYIYRVGSANNVKLSTLFELRDSAVDAIAPDKLNVFIENVHGNAGGKYTAYASAWGDGTISFSGTGVVKVTATTAQNTDELSEKAAAKINPVTLYLEVVNGYNVTEISNYKANQTNVLLDNIWLTDAKNTVSVTSGKTLYGNGYTFDITKGVNNDGSRGIIKVNSGTLDNVRIEGAVYDTAPDTTAAGTADTTAAVLAQGTTKIKNCYISNCRAPLRTQAFGTITVSDTVLDGGRFANIDFQNGILNLNNVTTINQPVPDSNGNKTEGFGIVASEYAANSKINISGEFKQYNWLSKKDSDYFPSGTARNAYNAVFQSSASDFHHYFDSVVYANAGIISLTKDFTADDITGLPSCYGTTQISAGYNAYSIKDSDYDISEKDLIYRNSLDRSFEQNQGLIEPTLTWSAYSGGEAVIKFEKGKTQEIKLDVLTAKKNGSVLPVAVKYGNEELTQNIFILSEEKEYVFTYCFTDPHNYDKDGNMFDHNYEIELRVKVRLIDLQIPAPTITYGGHDYSSPTVFNDENWIQPESTSWTHNGINCFEDTGYYKVDKIGNNVFRYFPIYYTISINDNAVYSGNAAKPDNLSVSAYKGVLGSSVSKIDQLTFESFNGVTCAKGYGSGSTDSNKSTEAVYIKYTYEAANGATYCWWICYSTVQEETGTCLVEGTLITLADGTQKPVEALTGKEELLVWNLETGRYDSAPIVFVDSEETADYEVATLHFSNGDDVEIVYEHGFFDYDLGKYVYIHPYDYEQYIGHSFIALGDTDINKLGAVTLTGVDVETKNVALYSPVTQTHLCYFTNGMLSMPGGISGLFNIFEVNTTLMKYDEEKKQRDIEEYGLMTLEDYNGAITQKMYDSFNGQYLAVAIGKGLITMDEINALAERYAPLTEAK